MIWWLRYMKPPKKKNKEDLAGHGVFHTRYNIIGLCGNHAGFGLQKVVSSPYPSSLHLHPPNPFHGVFIINFSSL